MIVCCVQNDMLILSCGLRKKAQIKGIGKVLGCEANPYMCEWVQRKSVKAEQKMNNGSIFDLITIVI